MSDMMPIETPIQQCFSSDKMKGAYYHEFNADSISPHTVHKYDEDGNYVLGSTQNINYLPKERIFYVSDRFGNRIQKGTLNGN